MTTTISAPSTDPVVRRAPGRRLRAWHLLCGAALALAACAKELPSDGANAQMTRIDNLRAVRYCEVFLIGGDPNPIDRHLQAAFYNTSELNIVANRMDTCPQAMWDRVDRDALKRQYNVLGVFKNGPRGWTNDTIELPVGATRSFEGLQARWMGVVNLPPNFGSGSVAYQPTTVNRRSRMWFRAGRPVFVLDTPQGPAVMQAFSAIVDPNLTYDQLNTLGSRLRLPQGWRFRVVTIPRDLEIQAVNGQAHIVQDDLENTYDICTPGACTFLP